MKIRSATLVAAVAAVALMLGGCGPSGSYLQWEPRVPAMQVQGRVAIKMVPNMRPAGHGDTEMNNLGNERSGFGIPFAVRLEDGTTLDGVLSRMVAEAMISAGIGTAGPGDPNATANLAIEIHQFWCDGYAGYKGTVELQLVLLDPASGAVRIRVPVTKDGSGGSCRDAYRGALTAVSQELVIAFSSPAVRAAAIGGGGAAPPPAAGYAQPGYAAPGGQLMLPAAGGPPPASTSTQCAPGKSVTAITAGRCCWPGQGWSDPANRCVGPPQCPPGWLADESTCVVNPSR